MERRYGMSHHGYYELAELLSLTIDQGILFLFSQIYVGGKITMLSTLARATNDVQLSPKVRTRTSAIFGVRGADLRSRRPFQILQIFNDFGIVVLVTKVDAQCQIFVKQSKRDVWTVFLRNIETIRADPYSAWSPTGFR